MALNSWRGFPIEIHQRISRALISNSFDDIFEHRSTVQSREFKSCGLSSGSARNINGLSWQPHLFTGSRMALGAIIAKRPQICTSWKVCLDLAPELMTEAEKRLKGLQRGWSRFVTMDAMPQEEAKIGDGFGEEDVVKAYVGSGDFFLPSLWRSQAVFALWTVFSVRRIRAALEH